MSGVFGAAYADVYDSLYADKDYPGECDLIESLVGAHTENARRLLDLGCGTGVHAVELARRGFSVTGVDRAKSMLERAETRSAELGAAQRPTFVEGDLLTVDLGESFDVALMMFAVLGYQHANDDVLSAFRTARRHLRPGGLLVFDVWYGPAVLHERPSTRVKTAPIPEGEILRVTTSELDVLRHLCSVRFQVWRLDAQVAPDKADETHVMRYFFPLELKLYAELSGFTLLKLGDFSDPERSPDETTWNILAVARAT